MIQFHVVRDKDLGLLELDIRYTEKHLCFGLALFRIGFQLIIGPFKA